MHWSSKLQSLGFAIKEWREPDRNNELTAICTGIIRGDDRKAFRNLQLFKTQEITSTCCG